MIAFVLSHGVALAAIGVALVDFVIELNPNLAQNSIISLALSFLKKESGKV